MTLTGQQRLRFDAADAPASERQEPIEAWQSWYAENRTSYEGANGG